MATKKKTSRKGEKPKKRLSLRVPADLYERLDALKEREGISLQGAGLVALREYVEKRGA